MRHRDRAGRLVDEECREGRSHACGVRIDRRAFVDPPVGLGDECHEYLFALAPQPTLSERGRGQPRRDLTRLCSADAVGDGEERWLAHVRVLVVEPAATRIRERRSATDPHASTRNSVSPIFTRSPGSS